MSFITLFKLSNTLCCFFRLLECGEPLAKMPEEEAPFWSKMLSDMFVVCAASGDDFENTPAACLLTSLHITHEGF